MLRYTKDALLVFLLLALAYAYFYQDPGWNGNARLGLTFAIVREGRLTIDSYYNTDASGLKTGDKSVNNGHYYTDKAIGSSVLAAVAYYPIYGLMRVSGHELDIWIQKYLLTFLIMGLPSAFSGSLVYIFCRYLAKSRLRAFVVTLAIALGTIAFPFSVIFFGHQLAGSLLFIAFFLIFQLKLSPPDRHAGVVHLFLIGLVLGLALLTDFTTAVVAGPLMLYYFYVLWIKGWLPRIPNWLFPVLGGAIPMLLMVGYNVAVYAKPFASGYQYLSNPYYKEAMSHGIMGVGWPRKSVLFYETLHPAQGLLWQSPVLIMAAVGAFFMLRGKKNRLELALAVLACAAYLLLNSGYFLWWGGYSFAPRQIVPMLPFLCIPLIFVPRRFFPLVIVLTLVSIFQMTLVSASNVMAPDDIMVKIAKISFFEYSSIYSYCLKELIAGHFAWNMGQAWLGLKGWLSLLPFAALLAAGAGLMLRLDTTLPELVD
jgi:hypothetical protein